MSILNRFKKDIKIEIFWNIGLHKGVLNSKDKKLSSRHTNTNKKGNKVHVEYIVKQQYFIFCWF